jgi:hypothetical protein
MIVFAKQAIVTRRVNVVMSCFKQCLYDGEISLTKHIFNIEVICQVQLMRLEYLIYAGRITDIVIKY